MNIIIQKFGGTSVSTEENRLHCLKHIKRELENGNKVVVVVSAMGRKGDPYATDTLLSLIGTKPDEVKLNKRELDLFLSTGELISASVFSSLLTQKNITNTVLTGGQAGIITNNDFNDAKITSLKPNPILNLLKTNDVIVVTGFQGITDKGEVTTLGRGGSDTSATALGASLQAKFVDIFTDVDGVYTADPRIVNEAHSIPVVGYKEISNFAQLGAKVIHPRAVEFAMQQNIPIRVRSTFSDSEGTLISNFTELDIKERLITGITQTDNVVQITINKDDNNENFPQDIFKSMKDNDISVDLINVSTLDKVIYTVSSNNSEKAKMLLEELNYNPIIKNNCSKVSIVGGNMSGVPGVMFQIIQCLSNEGIDIYQSADSHTTIWVLVDSENMNKAVCALHKQFKL